jgi:uncharacterized BrkB/YihY/UPF0761 family membrane protein
VRAAVGILVSGLQLVAAVLLVSPPSNTWFREMRAAKAVEQAMSRKKARPQKGTASTWPVELSPDGWVKRYTFGTVAISFAVGLLASWLVFNLVLYLQQTNYPKYPFDPFPNMMYAMSCLPAQAIALILGAVIGAVSTRIPKERWRRATYGVCIAAFIAILVAIIGAGVIPDANW